MQYKFRGKRKDNGEWVTGCYVCSPAFPFNDSKNFIVEFIGIESGEPIFDWHEVIEETVGQWTGMIDKKHEDLYSDDIVQSGTQGGGICLSIITWIGQRACFEGCTLSIHNSIPQVYRPADQFWFCEKIGNIHDHPHLLTPSQKGDVLNTMKDPNLQAASEAVNAEATTEQVAAVEQEAQEQAMESAEEGGTEG